MDTQEVGGTCETDANTNAHIDTGVQYQEVPRCKIITIPLSPAQVGFFRDRCISNLHI